MTITKAQRWKILELWSAACRDRGWRASDRALRLATFSRILGREITTTDDIGRLDECTKLMAELKAMRGTDVNAGLEATNPGRNRARNWRWLIRYVTLPCLALYEPDPLAYLRTILEQKTRHRKTDRPERPATMDDFDDAICKQIYMTLHARLNTKRAAAGHTIHEMRLAAGVPCDCAKCRKAVPPIPPLEAPISHPDHDADHELRPF